MWRSILVPGLVPGLALGLLALASAGRTAADDDLCGEARREPQALYEHLAKDSRLREMGRDERYVGLENGQDGTLWSFTLPAHPAHPAAVCRRVMERRGRIEVPTTIVCKGPDAECKKLESDFDALNARIIEDLYKRPR
jgi:hypothetical protein